MIERYSLPAMKAVWSEDHMFELWLRIEVAASEAWTELGVVSREDMALIRKAKFSRAAYDQWFDDTKHDIVSFTRAVGESLGEERRWLHHGLTSNDVKDTALSLQLVEALEIIRNGVKRLMDVTASRAIEHKDTPCMGRSHGIHAEPLSFGLKLALWWTELARHLDRLDETKSRVAVGKLSGPVGTYASVPPEIESYVCGQLGLTPAPVSNQVIQRDRHAEFVQSPSPCLPRPWKRSPPRSGRSNVPKSGRSRNLSANRVSSPRVRHPCRTKGIPSFPNAYAAWRGWSGATR